MAEYPRPETTLAVILGASEFAKTSLAPNAAFAASARAFTDYILEDFGLPKGNLLNLFDTEHSASDVDGDIADFLQKHTSEDTASGSSIQDVLFYYVGHGGFTDDGGPVDYFLALRSTREKQKRSSGFQILSLATTLKRFATHLRKYLILDCCFAAAAYSSLQSPPLQLATEQVAKVLQDPSLPSRGTALFCAASKTEPAKAPPNCEYTMFSTALLQILREGDENAADLLSFQQLGDLVEKRIRQMFQDEAVRPQVNSPDQRLGNVAQVPFFPNPAKKVQVLQAQVERLTRQVHELTRQLADRGSQGEGQDQGAQESNLASGPIDQGNRPHHADSEVTFEAYTRRRLLHHLWNISRMTYEQWSALPEEVQSLLLRWEQSLGRTPFARPLCMGLLLLEVLCMWSGVAYHLGMAGVFSFYLFFACVMLCLISEMILLNAFDANVLSTPPLDEIMAITGLSEAEIRQLPYSVVTALVERPIKLPKRITLPSKVYRNALTLHTAVTMLVLILLIYFGSSFVPRP